jgi:monoamine oxidase
MSGIMDRKKNIIIVGGGAAGLMAARELLKQDHIVTILEASDRLGGRIHTVHDLLFEHPVEKGAEFIHGNLPVTLELLKEGNIKYHPVKGEMVRFVNNEWKNQDDFTIGWDEMIRKLNNVREDITLNEFLQQNFADKKYEELRRSVIRFAEGFDLADPLQASVLALREEWMEEEGEQYRIPGGLDQLINLLEKQCRELGCIISTSSAVTKINWRKDNVTAITKDQSFEGNKVIITVALGFLQKQTPEIIFNPAINNYITAAKQIGFGTVVKVLLQFKEAFWKEKKKNLGFLFADEMIPTWWTQQPSSYPLLTGWAGGPQAWPLENKSDEEISGLALQSLANVFNKSIDELKQLLTASLVVNWRNNPYTAGGYSYSTLETVKAQKLFQTPVDQTIYFAGEAFYNGPSPGTVEAALLSAKNVAKEIMKL